MLRILHISDSHAQSETLSRLDNLANECSGCEVVAHTGDCVSLSRDRAPAEWDSWPQEWKFSVPGNHDHGDTFDLLHTWTHRIQWTRKVADLFFLGVDPHKNMPHWSPQQRIELHEARGLVALFHMRPQDGVLRVLSKAAAHKPLLILHGHEHPNHFSGSEWDDTGRIEGRRYYRSHVCSSVSDKRGLAHIILWTGETFGCMAVQGATETGHSERKGLIVEHPKFGIGLLLTQQGAGDQAKLTINFPSVGRKTLLAPSLRLISGN